MSFNHYKLTISLSSLKNPVVIDFYCFSSRLQENVERILKRYNLGDINYYTIRSL